MASLVEKFGGERSSPVQYLRSMAVMKSNWLAMKKQFLTYMNAKRVEALEFRNEEEFCGLRPQTQVVTEVAFTMALEDAKEKEVQEPSKKDSQKMRVEELKQMFEADE